MEHRRNQWCKMTMRIELKLSVEDDMGAVEMCFEVFTYLLVLGFLAKLVLICRSRK